MRAILISDEIKEVEIEQGSLPDIYSNIGCENFESTGRIGENHLALADEEARLKSGPNTIRWVKWTPNTLLGNILIVGINDETGETVDCTLSVEEVQNQIAGVLQRTFNPNAR